MLSNKLHPREITSHPFAPLPQSTSRPRDVVSDYEYIVLLLKDFSHRKITRHIRPASGIQNRV
jgi:hypothetical protein